MARKTIVTIVCDLCGTDKNVESHKIAMDQKAPKVVDACTGCWGPVADVLENVMNAGTSQKIADRRVVAARGTRRSVTTPTEEAPTVRAPRKSAAKKAASTKNTGPKRTSKKASATNTTRAKKAPATARQSSDTETT